MSTFKKEPTESQIHPIYCRMFQESVQGSFADSSIFTCTANLNTISETGGNILFPESEVDKELPLPHSWVELSEFNRLLKTDKKSLSEIYMNVADMTPQGNCISLRFSSLKLSETCLQALNTRAEELLSGTLRGKSLITFIQENGGDFHDNKDNDEFNGAPCADRLYYNLPDDHPLKAQIKNIRINRDTHYQNGLEQDIEGKPALTIEYCLDVIIAAQHFNAGVAGKILSKDELKALNEGNISFDKNPDEYIALFSTPEELNCQ